MKIDFSATITDLDGVAMQEAGQVVTLGKLAVNSLLSTLADGRGQLEQIEPAIKVKYALLAQDIHRAEDGVLDLVVEDIALLKDRIGRGYSQLAVMQAWKLLENE